MSLISGAPYHDDYNPSKQFTHIVANPGSVEQAREFTQVQTMIFDFLKRLSDTLLKDGNIVSGMSFEQDNNIIKVKDGMVYLDGKIHVFKEQTAIISAIGTSVVGVRLEEVIITGGKIEDHYDSDDYGYYYMNDEGKKVYVDESLLDPATGMGNFGLAGADRVMSYPVLTVDDENSNELYIFEDGELKIAPSIPELDGVTDILAKRTYDESGNYRVRGLELDVEPLDADNMQAVINVGTAYIKGYEVTKPFPVKRTIPMSTTTSNIVNEPKQYVEGVNNYALNYFPASKITEVSAPIQVTETKTRASGNIDYLDNTSVLSIDSVFAGTTVYQQGVHYKKNADGIQWIHTTRPDSGKSFTVVYTYLKVLEPNVDYKFSQVQTDAWGTTKDYLTLLDGGVKPPKNAIIYINYDYYLARIDAITLDKDGNVVVVEGQPATQHNVREPIIINEDLLLLGYIYLPPNSGNGKAVNKVVTRTDMATIQKMGERLNDVEYNLALTQLDIEAITGESPSELQGVFTDGFYTTTKCDVDHPECDCMFSLEDAMILIPYTDVKTEETKINIGSSQISDSFGRLVTAPFEEVVGIYQHYATTNMLINPYLAVNTLAIMKVIPEVDNWIDNETINLQEWTISSRRFNRWWGHVAEGYRLDADLVDAKLVSDGSRLEDFRGWDKQFDVETTTKSQQVVEEAVTYMRQQEIEIQVTNLIANADKLKCTFDGKPVHLTAIEGYGTSHPDGTARANGNGVLHAKFEIPSGVKTGTREVYLYNELNGILSNSCSASYTSIGTKRTTTNTVFHNRITLNAVDPLAQTFSFSEDTIVTSVGLYFVGDKSDNKNVIVQIRNTLNGYPSNTVYEEVVVPTSQIKFSEKANLETRIVFNDPVYCEAGVQYAICVETDSATHSLGICELGGTDMYTNERVTKQPYLAGMLFSSSNGLAWTAHQASNMKFKVYKAVFEKEGVIEFDALTNVSLDALLVMADYLTPHNTGCVWEFATSKYGTYVPLTTYAQLELPSVIKSVYLRATFKANTNLSPTLARDSFTFIGFLQAKKGTYISKNISLADYYTSVRITYEAYEPAGSSVLPSIAYDTDGKNWITTPTSMEETELIDGWKLYEATFNVSPTLHADQFRVRLDLNANNSMVIRPKAKRLTVVLN